MQTRRGCSPRGGLGIWSREHAATEISRRTDELKCPQLPKPSTLTFSLTDLDHSVSAGSIWLRQDGREADFRYAVSRRLQQITALQYHRPFAWDVRSKHAHRSVRQAADHRIEVLEIWCFHLLPSEFWVCLPSR